MDIIQAEHLTKTYRRFKKEAGFIGSVKSLFKREYVEKNAVSDLTLSVQEGEFVGLIGPNGAGKTTLVKMLTGIIAPTEGRLSVMGYTPNKLENDFKKQYAIVMGQKSQLFFELTAADTFSLFKELYEIPEKKYQENLHYFIELFGIKPLLNVQVRTLSLGERMKMELVVALLHQPKVLFLDEPTIGLDAVAQKQIRDFLKEINRTQKTTIVLTSHYMEDIKSLCRRCVVINGGQKIYDGSTQTLFERYQTHKKITVSCAENSAIVLPEYCRQAGRGENTICFMSPKEKVNQVLSGLMQKYELFDIAVEEDIGDVVEKIYQEAPDEKISSSSKNNL